MKKTIISVALAVFLLNGYSQEKKETKTAKSVNVPELVKKAFAAEFPSVAKVKWSIEKPGEYEAEFDLNKTGTSALFDSKGVVLEKESKMKESDLPQTIKSALAKGFVGYKISEIEKTDSKGKVTYEMEAKKGKKESELVFDASGKLMKQAAEKKD